MMYQKNIEPTVLCEQKEPVYSHSRNLIQKGYDKVLLGAITLDTLLGNPSVAYANEISKNGTGFSLSGDDCIYTSLALCTVGVLSKNPIVTIAGFGFSVASFFVK